MADATRTFGTLALATAAAVAVPIVLGSLYTTWSQVQQPPRAVVAAPRPASAKVVEEAPPEPEAPEPPAWPREIDGQVFRHLEGTLVAGLEAKDIVPDAPYRIDLSRPTDVALVKAATVDLDRDGKWDERWSFEGAEVIREASPADDGRYPEKYRWTAGDWVKIDPPVGGEVRASYRYALAAVVATALAVGLGAWLGTRPLPSPIELPAPSAKVDAKPRPNAPTALEREGALDRIEATEAEQFGAEEAAERRHQRERMLDLRLGEHE